MPMHFIHRLDRLHMRLADSPQGKPVPAEASPVRKPASTRITRGSSHNLRLKAQRQPPPASTQYDTAPRKATRRSPA